MTDPSNIAIHVLSYLKNRFEIDNSISPPHFALHIIKFYGNKKTSMADRMSQMITSRDEQENELIKRSINYALHFALYIGTKKIQEKNKIQTEEEYQETIKKIENELLQLWNSFCQLFMEDSYNTDDPNNVKHIDYV